MRDAFEDYLLDNSNIKAIFVGTRRTDPFAQTLQHFDPTDHGWPKFVRIHPVLDWHYANVWTVGSMAALSMHSTDGNCSF